MVNSRLWMPVMRSNTFLSGLRRAIRINLFLKLGVCVSLLLPLWAQTASYKVLYSFDGPTSDGKTPGAILVEPDGIIYGTAIEGGSAYNGTAFKLSPKGKETILYNFNAGYGSWPVRLLAWKGEFYGATYQGGAHRTGTVFRLDKKGNEVVLYNFPRYSCCPDLDVVDENGIFYGTTQWSGNYSHGTVFKMDSSGKLTTLYNFTGGSDGADPCCLARDAQGNLYGFTTYPPNGSVFRLDTAGTLTTLYAFTGGTDGGYPSAGLILDTDGNLYGGTDSGGNLSCLPPYGCGTIFMLDTSGNEKVLYSFPGGPDGVGPSSLIRDTHGNLYGTTLAGGDAKCYPHNYAPGCGIVFKLDATGKETVLHVFTSSPDGAFPQWLTMDPAGDLYGTTDVGGNYSFCTPGNSYIGCGTVFKLTH